MLDVLFVVQVIDLTLLILAVMLQVVHILWIIYE